VLAIGVALVMVANNALGYGLTGVETWKLVLDLIGYFSLAAAAVLIVGALVPVTIADVAAAQRERFVFYALALFAVALIVVAVLASHTAYQLHTHQTSIGG